MPDAKYPMFSIPQALDRADIASCLSAVSSAEDAIHLGACARKFMMPSPE